MARVFSERLKAARKTRGVTQKELADKLGMEKSAVSKFERDVNSADAELLAKICRALDVSPYYLLGLSDVDEELDVSKMDTNKSDLSDLVEAYKNAPDDKKGIVDYVLAPYKQAAPGGRAAS